MDGETLPQNNWPLQRKNRLEKQKAEVEETESNEGLSKTGWALVIGVLVMIDLVQIVLDLMGGIGLVLNRFLDIIVGMALPFTLYMCGENVVNPKKLLALAATFIGEEIPVADALPLWTLDGIYYMLSSKVIKKVPVVGKVISGADKVKLVKNPITKPGQNINGKVSQKPNTAGKTQTQNERVVNRNVVEETEQNSQNPNIKENNRNKTEEKSVPAEQNQRVNKKSPPQIIDTEDQKLKINNLQKDLERMERQRDEAKLDLRIEQDNLVNIKAKNDLQKIKVSEATIGSLEDLIYSNNVLISSLKRNIDEEKLDLMEMEQQNEREMRRTM